MKLGRNVEAEEKIRSLIADNTECKSYYPLLAQARGLAAGEQKTSHKALQN